jgi:divalent metal cation (Fe/Co/Zn/Cd) transporter
LGGLFSIYEGIHKLHSTEELNSPYVAIIVLSVSMLLEAVSLWGCITQINKVRHGVSLWQWLKNSRQSELVVVFGEDIAALFGLLFALVAVVLSLVTGNPIYDSIGSIGIGVLLVIVSFFVAVKVKSLLIGQSADEDIRLGINDFLEKRPEIEQVLNVITLQLGPQIMLTVKAKMAEKKSVEKLINDINVCEKELKSLFPTIQWVFFEPDKED